MSPKSQIWVRPLNLSSGGHFSQDLDRDLFTGMGRMAAGHLGFDPAVTAVLRGPLPSTQASDCVQGRVMASISELAADWAVFDHRSRACCGGLSMAVSPSGGEMAFFFEGDSSSIPVHRSRLPTFLCNFLQLEFKLKRPTLELTNLTKPCSHRLGADPLFLCCCHPATNETDEPRACGQAFVVLSFHLQLTWTIASTPSSSNRVACFAARAHACKLTSDLSDFDLVFNDPSSQHHLQPMTQQRLNRRPSHRLRKGFV